MKKKKEEEKKDDKGEDKLSEGSSLEGKAIPDTSYKNYKVTGAKEGVSEKVKFSALKIRASTHCTILLFYRQSTR